MHASLLQLLVAVLPPEADAIAVRSSGLYEPKLMKHDACWPYSLRCRCNRASSWVVPTGESICFAEGDGLTGMTAL